MKGNDWVARDLRRLSIACSHRGTYSQSVKLTRTRIRAVDGAPHVVITALARLLRYWVPPRAQTAMYHHRTSKFQVGLCWLLPRVVILPASSPVIGREQVPKPIREALGFAAIGPGHLPG